jgi:hypothetical protein
MLFSFFQFSPFCCAVQARITSGKALLKWKRVHFRWGRCWAKANRTVVNRLEIVHTVNAILRLWMGEGGNMCKISTDTPPPTPTPNTLATNLSWISECLSNRINTQRFYRTIDEFRIYARELSLTDVFSLANPWNCWIYLTKTVLKSSASVLIFLISTKRK